MKIETTSEYGLFKGLVGNRDKDEGHVAAIHSTLVKHPELAAIIVILVNDKMEIIDGQHRFEALKGLRMPVNYVKVDGMGVEAARALNTNSKNWTPMDWAKSYARLGSEDYAKYIELRETYNISHLVTCQVLAGKGKGILGVDRQSRYKFKQGGLVVTATPEEVGEFMNFLERAADIWPKFMHDTYPARALHHAWLVEGFDKERMLERIRIRADYLNTVVWAHNVRDSLRLLEDIYNYDLGEAKHARFF